MIFAYQNLKTLTRSQSFKAAKGGYGDWKA